MSRSGWHTALIAPARDLEGHSTQVIAGVIHWRGRGHVAVRLGEDGNTVLLAERATRELIANLHTALNERRELP